MCEDEEEQAAGGSSAPGDVTGKTVAIHVNLHCAVTTG